MSTREEAASLLTDFDCDCPGLASAVALRLLDRDKEIADLRAKLATEIFKWNALDTELRSRDKQYLDLRAALDRLNDDCLRAEQEREQLRTKLAEAEAKLACDACDGSGIAISGTCGCQGKGLPGMLESVRLAMVAAEQRAREAEVRGLEKASKILLDYRPDDWNRADPVNIKFTLLALINAEIARLKQGDELTESYDCPIHGTGEGKDCPRC